MSEVPSRSVTPMQTPSGSSVSSAAALSDYVKWSIARAQNLTKTLKHDTQRSHIAKNKAWRKFVEHELHDLKDSLRTAPLTGAQLRSAQEYMQALDRSQRGTALRSHTWMRDLMSVVTAGSNTRFNLCN